MASEKSAVRHRRRRRRTRRFLWIPVVLIPLLALGGAWLWFHQHYVVAGGEVYPRTISTLDLRGERISPERYESLRETLPDCRILWDVPLGGERYDCTSGAVTLSGFSAGDEKNLSYFSDLQAVDAVDAPLTPAQYEAIRAALPEAYIRWCVPIGGGRYPSDAREIVLTGLSAEDIPLFAYFTDLRTIDARSCGDYDALMALRSRLPEADLLWKVPFSGTEYLQDARDIAVTDPSVTAQELARALALLPAAETVTAEECAWTEEEKNALAEEFPSIRFLWPTTLRGVRYTTDMEALSFAGEALTEADAAELREKLGRFPALRTLDLTGTGLSDEQVWSICDANPELDVIWTFDLLGKTVSTQDTLIDLSNTPVESTEVIERVLPYMHHLEKVDMCDCGISDEEMDALNKRHENVRFVWMLHIMYYKIRTDAVGFRATSNHYSSFNMETAMKLGYCEDMVALDLGHRPVPTLEFLYTMPHVKYLTLLDCHAMDLSPIASLPELVWLEMNRAYASSLAPLTGCKTLRDLNITFMTLEHPEDTYTTLMEMPWLERVWFSRALLTTEQEQSLQTAHPDCVYHVVFAWEQSNEDPWRFDQDYYDMRDTLGMFYMNGNSRIDYKVIDGVRYELDPEFLAQQGDTSHDRDR